MIIFPLATSCHVVNHIKLHVVKGKKDAWNVLQYKPIFNFAHTKGTCR